MKRGLFNIHGHIQNVLTAMIPHDQAWSGGWKKWEGKVAVVVLGPDERKFIFDGNITSKKHLVLFQSPESTADPVIPSAPTVDGHGTYILSAAVERNLNPREQPQTIRSISLLDSWMSTIWSAKCAYFSWLSAGATGTAQLPLRSCPSSSTKTNPSMASP